MYPTFDKMQDTEQMNAHRRVKGLKNLLILFKQGHMIPKKSTLSTYKRDAVYIYITIQIKLVQGKKNDMLELMLNATHTGSSPRSDSKVAYLLCRSGQLWDIYFTLIIKLRNYYCLVDDFAASRHTSDIWHPGSQSQKTQKKRKNICQSWCNKLSERRNDKNEKNIKLDPQSRL